MSTTSGQRLDSRHGAAMVEFALVCPLFLLLLGGIIEFGLTFRLQHGLANAARRACRTAIVSGTTTAGVVQKAQSQCAQTLGITGTDVTVVVALNGINGADLSQAKQGDTICVTTSLPYDKAGTGFFLKMMTNKSLTSACIMEHE